MNTREIEADARAVLRLACGYLSDAVSVLIDRQGIHIVVASDVAARRITEPHGFGRAVDSSMVRYWTGKVNDVPVSVRIDDQSVVPAQREQVAS